MAQQKAISERLNRKYLGTVQKILLESAPEPGLSLGRTMFQAPEVDGLTYVRAKASSSTEMLPGRFIEARIVDTLEYDLVGEPL
jgi:ribosomal protein S12 methylthiotransferase